jgi:hypothetical protein
MEAKKRRENFINHHRSFITFTIKLLNFKKCQFSVSIFHIFSISAIHYNFSLNPNGWVSKFLKYPSLLLEKKKKILQEFRHWSEFNGICKNSYTWIFDFFIFIFILKKERKNSGVLRMLREFNGKF